MKFRLRSLRKKIPRDAKSCGTCFGTGKTAPGQKLVSDTNPRVVYTPKGAVTCKTCRGYGWVRK